MRSKPALAAAMKDFFRRHREKVGNGAAVTLVVGTLVGVHMELAEQAAAEAAARAPEPSMTNTLLANVTGPTTRAAALLAPIDPVQFAPACVGPTCEHGHDDTVAHDGGSATGVALHAVSQQEAVAELEEAGVSRQDIAHWSAPTTAKLAEHLDLIKQGLPAKVLADLPEPRLESLQKHAHLVQEGFLPKEVALAPPATLDRMEAYGPLRAAGVTTSAILHDNPTHLTIERERVEHFASLEALGITPHMVLEAHGDRLELYEKYRHALSLGMKPDEIRDVAAKDVDKLVAYRAALIAGWKPADVIAAPAERLAEFAAP